MMIAPATALRLIQRAEHLIRASKAVDRVTNPFQHYSRETLSLRVLRDAADVVCDQAIAWEDTVLDRDWGDTVYRLFAMQRHPHQFSAAELLANRDTLGMTERWCRERAGSRESIVRGGNNPDYSAAQVMA